MATDYDDLKQRVDFFVNKLGRVEDAVAGIFSGLATASTLQRINGNLLIPETVVTDKVGALAITTTKINSEAVTTPKVAANAITANKLETQLVLSTEIVAGSYSDPDYHGVRLDSSGLRLYNGSGTQRGLLSSDGSGWFGTSTGFTWDTAGAITATGITVRSAASGARSELVPAGLNLYNSSAVNTVSLLSTGGGRLGSTDGTDGNSAIYWGSSGLAVINATRITTGALDADLITTGSIDATLITTGTLDASLITVNNLSADSITTGTLVADRISGGNLGGGFNLGSSDITVNSTGKLYFGSGSNDYLANDVLHFAMTGTDTGKVEFTRSGYTPTSKLTGLIGSTTGNLAVGSYYGTRHAEVITIAASTDGNTRIELETADSSGLQTASYIVAGNGNHTWAEGYNVLMTLVPTNRALSLYGRLYPGTGSGTQSSFYIDYTATGFPSSRSGIRMYEASGWAGLDEDGRFVASGNIFPGNQDSVYIGENGGNLQIASGTAGSATAGAATLPSNPVGFLIINIGGTARKIPYYAT